MTSPTRIAVKDRTIVVIEAALGESVLVRYNDATQADGEPPALVILGRIRGDVSTSAFALDGNALNDDYTIEGIVVVRRDDSDEHAADVRCQEILDLIEQAMFRRPRLGSGFEAVATDPGRVDGPNSSPSQDQGSHAVSAAFFDLAFRVPKRGS